MDEEIMESNGDNAVFGKGGGVGWEGGTSNLYGDRYLEHTMYAVLHLSLDGTYHGMVVCIITPKILFRIILILDNIFWEIFGDAMENQHPNSWNMCIICATS